MLWLVGWLSFCGIDFGLCVAVQSWLQSAVERETAAGGVVSLNQLAAGSPQAFIVLHTAAMISLVVTEPTVTVAFPETLMFDERRIASLRYRFDAVVTGSTLLVMVRHALLDGGAVALSPEKRTLLEEVSELVLRENADFGAIVATDLPEMLDAAGLLVADPAERTRVLAALATGVANRDHAVRRVM
jgi:hypothetical protein